MSLASTSALKVQAALAFGYLRAKARASGGATPLTRRSASASSGVADRGPRPIVSYLRLPADPTLDATGPFTIAAWVKRASTGSYHTIVDRGLGVSDPQSSYTLRLENSNVAHCEWEDGGTNVAVNSDITITDNAWHHIAGVFDGSNNIIYVDGEPHGAATTALSPTVDESGVQIGARRTGPTVFELFFEDQVDEVAFYRRALSSQEVALLAADGNTVPALSPTGLLILIGSLVVAALARGPDAFRAGRAARRNARDLSAERRCPTD